MMRRQLSLLILLFFCQELSGQYSFSGVAPDEFHGEVVYLDILDDWDHFHWITDLMPLQRTEIDSNGRYAFAGTGLPAQRGFYRLRFRQRTDPPVSMNFRERHFIHFTSGPEDSLTFSGLSIVSPSGANVLITEVAAELDQFDLEESSAESERLNSIINERRRQALVARLSAAGADEQIFLLGNLPAETVSQAQLKDLEQLLESDTELRPTFLESVQKSIGGLDAGKTMVTNNWLRWLLAVSLLGNALALGWYLRQRLIKRRSAAAENRMVQPEFTTKESEVLELIRAGNTNKEIALQLFVSPATVKTHINSIYRKTGVSGRKELLKGGWVQESTPV